VTITITPNGAFLDGRKLAISLPDAALLGKPSLTSYCCVICGWTGHTETHHFPYKSRVPKSLHDLIPTFPVCGWGNADGCHGMLHGVPGRLTLHYDEGWWVTPDERAAKELGTRKFNAGRAVRLG